MYTISEFGMKTGISTRTLRFYEEIGLLYPSDRNTSGHRLYGLSALATLQQIQSLKFIGYSLQEIKNFLEERSTSMDHLESSLPLQKKLLMEKRDELNRAINSIDYVQGLLKEGHSMTWRHLSSLLQSIECEEDQKEWMKEYFSEEFAQQYFDLTKEQRQELDKDWMLILADIKKLMKDHVPAHAPEAKQVIVRMLKLLSKSIPKEELLTYMKKVEHTIESGKMDDFNFPNFWTLEEETYIEEVMKAMEQETKE